VINCEKCFKVLMTVQESSYLRVTGEVKLIVLCQSCQYVNHIELYKYDKNSLKK
jgi:phage FluMu protein Com